MSEGLDAALALDYPGFALDVAFTAPARGVTALFGPSGAGKTTLLRCIAGLQRAPHGHVRLGAATWQDEARRVFLPTHRRPLGLVFQEQSLFPHLSVRDNLAYGWRRVPAAERRVPFHTVERLLGLTPLMQRRPQGLSGGERQRVALGRALLTSPRLLLLDEPLASLDRASKAEIIPYLERLRAELALPILYVSHDLDEVARLADHVVLLRGGRVARAGPARALLGTLATSSDVEGEPVSVLDAEIAGYDARDRLLELRFSGGRLLCPGPEAPVGQRVRVRVYARDVSLALHPLQGVSILNVLPVTVTAVHPEAADAATVSLDAGGATLLCHLTRRSVRELGVAPSLRCHALVKGVALLR